MQFFRLLLPKLNQQRKLDVLPLVEFGGAIPKIIHQTFPVSQLPKEIEENVSKLKTSNPGWEYRFYEDKDIARFIQQSYNDEILDYYNRIDAAYGAARADFFRYLVIYKCGGVYLDMKSTATLPLDSVLKDNDSFIISHWQNKKGEEFDGYGFHWDLPIANGEFQQWHVIAAPGHPFLKAVIETILMNIDRYLPSLHGVGQYGVMRVTGPITYTKTIAPLMKFHPHRVLDADTDLGLKYSIYPKFSHMKIYKAKHYTVLKKSIVHLGAMKNFLTSIIAKLQKLDDILKGRKPVVAENK
jgi:mannosyltransferase OCH1-like enzyme